MSDLPSTRRLMVATVCRWLPFADRAKWKREYDEIVSAYWRQFRSEGALDVQPVVQEQQSAPVSPPKLEMGALAVLKVLLTTWIPFGDRAARKARYDELCTAYENEAKVEMAKYKQLVAEARKRDAVKAQAEGSKA